MSGEPLPLNPEPLAVDPILDNAPCGFLTFGDDGVVQLANATFLEMLGYGSDEVVGHHIERLMPVGSRIFYQTHWFPLLRLHGEAEEIFLMLRGKSGEQVGVLVNASARAAAGASRRVYDCVFMHVRERQKYEQELLSARKKADLANLELERQAVELRDANGKLEAQALELEMQQQQLEEQAVVLEETSEELRVINEDLLARTEEAEQLRDTAEAANRAKSTFLAIMSHELRTPLNAIAGYVQLMEMGIHGPVTAAQEEALSRISRSQRHLLRLINDVLDLARIESGRVEYLLEAVDVAEMVTAVSPMIEPQLAKKHITFTTSVPKGVMVRVDREKVQQILLNLLGNSVKFTPDGGTVSVHAASHPDGSNFALISVEDTGIGIPPHKLGGVFEAFVQVDDGHNRANEGSGLGLAISRDLARGMGGDLTAESVLGKGSTFTVHLPIANGD